jgi:hypothetical protein
VFACHIASEALDAWKVEEDGSDRYVKWHNVSAKETAMHELTTEHIIGIDRLNVADGRLSCKPSTKGRYLTLFLSTLVKRSVQTNTRKGHAVVSLSRQAQNINNKNHPDIQAKYNEFFRGVGLELRET